MQQTKKIEMNDNEKLEVDLKCISFRQVKAALQVLIDNGIECEQAPVVLQAIGYALMNRELGSMFDLD